MIRDIFAVQPGQVLSWWNPVRRQTDRAIVMRADGTHFLGLLWENGESERRDVSGAEWNTVMAPTFGIPHGS